MKRTYDVHVKGFEPLLSPEMLKAELPMSDAATQAVIDHRRVIQNILTGRDDRLLVVTGPCSIHDEAAALEYAERLQTLQADVADTQFLVMRVYFEKPRTTVGWKGLINDPFLDGSCQGIDGLRFARQLLMKISDMGLPAATEMLDPITPQYIAGLISWAAIGARTIESQTHREMASGLSMPVGFKNCTDGGLDTALNAMIAAGAPQSFLGIAPDGRVCVVKTTGNDCTHIVLRGGRRPNYDSVSIRQTLKQLRAKGLHESIVVDCSHANSEKDFRNQAIVWDDVIQQRASGNKALTGLMLESNLNEGNQKNTGNLDNLKYGVSITDSCISWKTTENLIRSAHERIRQQ